MTFHLPATIGGREVTGVRLRFEAGKVVDATAERGEEYLISMLDTDEGARRLGELGIGTNYGIERAPARSCSTRRSAARSTWPSARAIRRPVASTRAPSTRTWSATFAAEAGSRWTAKSSSRTAPSPSESLRQRS